MAAKILLTGAAGYIGSHTWLALWSAGYDIVGIDNFSNSSPVVLQRLDTLGGRLPAFVRADVCDGDSLDRLFAEHRFDAVIHFAAHKSVAESVQRPLEYYRNNIGGLVTLCDAMQRHGCRRMVYSSSATVYGEPERLPLTEDCALSATNPYGQTKLMGEQILTDLGRADPQWQTACLRYFNPVGAHESGLIGEDPRGTPNNLMPYVAQVATGRLPQLKVFGSDYPTPDGTGVRDYIHVCDLAEGHVAALRRSLEAEGSFTVNLGTGRGHSVLDVVRAFERASGKAIPLVLTQRRPGDVPACYAEPQRAHELLGWQARHDLERMCADSWRWQQANPHGFEAKT